MNFNYYGCPGKKSWPELLGRNAWEAKNIIQAENPHVYVRILRMGQQFDPQFRCERVRIVVDDSNIVRLVPHVG